MAYGMGGKISTDKEGRIQDIDPLEQARDLINQSRKTLEIKN